VLSSIRDKVHSVDGASESQDKARKADVERAASSGLTPAARSFAAESPQTVHNCACRLELLKQEKMWAKIGFPWLAVLWVGHALSCWMRHPENASQTQVSELMEVVTELFDWSSIRMSLHKNSPQSRVVPVKLSLLSEAVWRRMEKMFGNLTRS